MDTFKRKPSTVTRSHDEIFQAVYAIKIKHKSIKQTSRDFQIPRTNLMRYCSKITKKELKRWQSKQSKNNLKGYNQPHKVFSREQELRLLDYIVKSADIYYGLTFKEIRKLAYQYGVMCNVRMPQNWSDNKSAGTKWFIIFRKRFKNEIPSGVSKPIQSARSRNVTVFSEKLRSIIQNYNLTSADIWNVERIGLTATVKKSKKTVDHEGFEQVNIETSTEPGSLMLAYSANNDNISPLFIFSRVHCHSYFLSNAPLRSEICANPSGSMKDDHSYLFLKHFVHEVKCSKEKPVLLLLDYHQPHLSLQAIDCARNNGVFALSFPLHWTRKLETLDMRVYDLLKCYNKSFCDYWVKKNPGKIMTNNDVPDILKWVLPLAQSTKNILASFQDTRICPLSSNVFEEYD